jgi:LysR family glycine cleavage system transcriptional activator
MRRLPPFPELVAFEAVARHLSFTRAAAELCLTQSAVSHRVRRLEQHYGTRLLRRLNPGLLLTEAGKALLPELAAALDALARLNGKRERRLRVTAGSALCTWWLAGRLASFMAQRPGISVDLIALEAPDPSIADVDVRIQWVAPTDETAAPNQAALFCEQVFPVCSPRLLPGGQPLGDAQALAGMTLLHKAVHASGEWSWPVWLERLGVEPRKRRGAELRFADMGLMLSAAVNGSGVCLARSLLVHDALRDGRLVVALAGFEPMTSVKKHIARWPSHKTGDADIEAFVSWLVDEAKRCLDETRTHIERGVAAPAPKPRAASRWPSPALPGA